jgi:hypothetical protein
MPEFIPGLELGRLFYEEVIKPILEADFADLRYSAALIGHGSEILGYDTERSTDHHWGPRVMLFLSEDDYARQQVAITKALRHKLPTRFRGYSTHFSGADNNGVQLLEDIDEGPVNHRVEIFTLRGFFLGELGFDPYHKPTMIDWLTFPEQKLLSLTAGQVYHDGLGELEALRATFSYYPHDLWLYLMAAQWVRIAQEEAFMGRCAEVGDELGSQIISGRLVRDMMKLCFLMERRYAPYNKWFGKAFSELQCAAELLPRLENICRSGDCDTREEYLSQAYSIVARMHNDLQITPPLSTEVSLYHGRPFKVIHGGRFAYALLSSITDEEVRTIEVPIGAIDQFIDSTDVLENPVLCRKLTTLFEE